MKTFGGTDIEIPYEVLQAHEEGRLVFFCGAGISYYTGLPGFRDLVVQAYRGLSPQLDPTAEKPDQWKTQHDAAFHSGRYDQALHLLERDCTRSIVRRKIINILSRPLKRGSGHLRLHHSLLTLARLEDGSGYRLVTTNFDNRFDKAQRGLSPVQLAPALGPPRRPGWRHITYLHGRIEPSDPDGDGLVVTSADFGAAYLRDGWAARFLVELLREFTVLFVGYSLNDPIVSYLVDALASEMRPDGQFQKAYVLAGYKDGNEERDDETWRAKGVTPILFSTGCDGKDWTAQDVLLGAWADEYDQGLSSRIATARQPTRLPYTEAISESEVKNVAWALSKSDASVAKAFAEADPPPHPSWLRPLSTVTVPTTAGHEGAGLFDLPSPKPKKGKLKAHHIAPLAGHMAACIPWLPLSPITFHLGRWLVRHMSDQETVIPWVIERQGVLHPEWLRFLMGEVDKVPEPYQSFWRPLLEGKAQPPCSSGLLFLRRFGKDWPPDGDDLLLSSARPWLGMSQPFRIWPSEGPPETVEDLVKFKIKLADGDIIQRVFEAREHDHVRQALTRLADPLTSRLLEVCRLAEQSSVSDATTRSYGAVPLVGEPGERRATEAWAALVHLVSESLFCLADQPEAAGTLANRWMMLGASGHVLFQRLALFAAAETDTISPARGLKFALEHDRIFWRLEAWPEFARFLHRRARDFTETDRQVLFATIEAGPPAGLFTSPPDVELIDRLRGRVLGKVLQGDGIVPEQWQVLAKTHQEIPERLIGDIKVGWRPNKTAESIEHLSPAEAATKIMEADGWDGGHMLSDLFKKCCHRAFATVEELIRNGEARSHVWGIGLEGLRDEKSREVIADALENFIDLAESHRQWLQIHAVRAISSVLNSWSENFPEDFDPAIFATLWSLLWDASEKNGASGLIDEEEGLDTAINAPGGNLAQALLARFFAFSPESGSGIPPELAPMFRRSTEGETLSHRFARIVYASRLVYLFNVDRQWAETAIIGLMHVDSGEALALWEGFLWNPRWHERLLDALSEPLKSILPIMEKRPERVSDRLGPFLAGVCISGRAKQAEGLLSEYLVHAPPRAMAQTAATMAHHLEDAADKAATLWRKTIGPLIDQRWPALRDKQTPETSGAFAGIALRSGDAFPDAVQTLLSKRLIIASDDSARGALGEILILTRISDDDEEATVEQLAQAYPRDMLDLLNAATGDTIDYWNRETMRRLLNMISTAAPEVLSTPAWLRLKGTMARG